jgi:5-methylcytosine-specific restriction endonuclease McrA
MKVWSVNHRQEICDRSNSWRRSHKEQKAETDRKYRNENKDKLRETSKRWRDKNRAAWLEGLKIYREHNKEKIREGKRKCWYAKHEHYLNKAKEWRENHLEQSNKIIRKSTLKRRAQKYNNGGDFTLDAWDELKENYGNQCLNCGKTRITLEVDHIVPLSLGGANDINNIQPLCRSCNARKHKSIINYRTQFDVVMEWT